MTYLPARPMLPAANVAAPAAGLAGAILLTVAVGAVINPRAFWAFMDAAAALGSLAIYVDMLARSGLLMLLGLAAALTCRAGLANFGTDGQMLCGMLVALGVGATPGLPGRLAVPAALIAAALAGGLMMTVATVLKIKRGADVAVVTLLMAVIARLGFDAVAPRVDVAGTTALALAPTWRAAIGCAAGIAVCALFFAVLRMTVVGFELRAAGGNPAAARFAGIRVGPVVTGSGLISGALAGVAGAAMQSGIIGISGASGTGGLGYAGIVVAMLAASEPHALVPTALAVGTISAIIDAASRGAGVNMPITEIVLGLSVVLTLGFRRLAPEEARP